MVLNKVEKVGFFFIDSLEMECQRMRMNWFAFSLMDVIFNHHQGLLPSQN